MIRNFNRKKEPIHKSNKSIKYLWGKKSLTRMFNSNEEKLHDFPEGHKRPEEGIFHISNWENTL